MSRKGPTYVLGTGLSHDGSACLLADGEIRVAIEKERLTRVKHDGFGDSQAIQYCLDAAGITFDDVELVVQNANFCNFDRGNRSFFGQPRIIPDTVPVVTISHHLAHAYSVVGTSPFDDMGVLVIDGCGSSFDDCTDLQGTELAVAPPEPDADHLLFEKDSYYAWRDGVLRPLYKDFSPWGYFLKGYAMCPPTTKHSIGGLYSGVSQYVFQGMEDPGKLMGLAPYGRPGSHDFAGFELRDGRCFVNYDWMAAFDRPRVRYEDLRESFQYYADLAYWMQREIERALLYVVAARHQRWPSDRLGYAGGVALNAVANAQILRRSPFRELYVQPAAADNGLAIGCAFYGWLAVLGEERRRHSGASWFGRRYAPDRVQAALDAHPGRLAVRRESDVVEATARLLADGKVVGWFEGGSEMGPRALGHRSILADPRRPEVGAFINAEVKFREDFRPFAPAVAVEHKDRYFDCSYDSPYMVLVAPVRPEWRERIPAVVHRDGSARIQTVSRELLPRFHDLLLAFERHSGIAVLLNTSFNRRGMPIVETPEEAIAFFLECALDALVIDDLVVTKVPAPAVAEVRPDEALEFASGLGQVYPNDFL